MTYLKTESPRLPFLKHVLDVEGFQSTASLGSATPSSTIMTSANQHNSSNSNVLDGASLSSVKNSAHMKAPRYRVTNADHDGSESHSNRSRAENRKSLTGILATVREFGILEYGKRAFSRASVNTVEHNNYNDLIAQSEIMAAERFRNPNWDTRIAPVERSGIDMQPDSIAGPSSASGLTLAKSDIGPVSPTSALKPPSRSHWYSGRSTSSDRMSIVDSVRTMQTAARSILPLHRGPNLVIHDKDFLKGRAKSKDEGISKQKNGPEGLFSKWSSPEGTPWYFRKRFLWFLLFLFLVGGVAVGVGVASAYNRNRSSTHCAGQNVQVSDADTCTALSNAGYLVESARPALQCGNVQPGAYLICLSSNK